MPCELIVSAERGGSRLDHFLRGLYPEISLNRWRKALAEGWVRVDGLRAAKGLILKAGQIVVLPAGLLDELSPAGPRPEAGPLEILYCDDDLIAVNKPAGCHTHPLRADETGTLVNRLLHHFPEISGIGDFGPLQPGILHRLDYLTSGLVLTARNQPTWEKFRGWFATHRIRKEYLAIVQGRLETAQTIDTALTHDRADPRRMALSPPADPCRGLYPARTEIFPLEYRSETDTTLVRLVMRTGVMHQLRVHSAAIGHPLAGDWLYGDRDAVCSSFPADRDCCRQKSALPKIHLCCHRLILPDGFSLSSPVPDWSVVAIAGKRPR